MSYFSKTPEHSILCAKAFLLKSCPKRQTPLLSLSLNLVLIILSNQLRCKIEENQLVVLLSQGKKPQDSHSSLLCPLEWPRTQLIHKNQKFSVQQHIVFIFLEIQVSDFAAFEESLQSLRLQKTCQLSVASSSLSWFRSTFGFTLLQAITRPSLAWPGCVRRTLQNVSAVLAVKHLSRDGWGLGGAFTSSFGSERLQGSRPEFQILRGDEQLLFPPPPNICGMICFLFLPFPHLHPLNG